MILKKLTVDHPDFPAVERLYEAFRAVLDAVSAGMPGAPETKLYRR